MPSPAFSSESGLESDAHLHISSSCASSGGGGGSVPSGAAGRILFSLPGGLAHHYNALQASMSSGDNFIQGGRNLSLAPGHGMLPLPSRVVHEGRVWTSFQVMPSASSMGQPSGVSVQGSQARHGDNSKTMEAANPGAMEEHGSNNEHGGASFAEHDYMSDVSSAPNEDSNKCGERGVGDGGKGCDDAQDTDSNLNLRETELRLGPPESSSSVAGEHNKSAAAALLSGAKRGFSEAIGGLSEPKRSLSEVAAVAAESKRGFQQESGSGHASAEQKLSAARNGGYTEAMINFQASFADVRSSYLDSRPGCLFDHQNGDGKGGSQQQQHQQHVNNRQQQLQHVTPSGFRVPSLPPPWQALDQSAASLGPFPSPKAAMEVSTMGKPPAEAPVVGWPPVRAFRKSTLSSPTPASTKSATDGLSAAAAAAAGTPAPPATPTASAVVPSAQARPVLEGMTKVMRPTPLVAAAAGDNGCRANGAPASSPNAVTSNYWFVKVYMDGVPFGRKVDLRIHGCYDKLSVGLEEMFTRYANVEQGSNGESKPLKFLQGSDYVLTYEDQDGDLMLVGDVPWNMFITSVKRLRIMKSSEAVGIAPRNSPKLWKGDAT